VHLLALRRAQLDLLVLRRAQLDLLALRRAQLELLATQVHLALRIQLDRMA
jgi:hypothetical protein